MNPDGVCDHILYISPDLPMIEDGVVIVLSFINEICLKYDQHFCGLPSTYNFNFQSSEAKK